MATIGDVISRGYLPKELPPPFRSETFGRAIEAALSTLPSEFDGNSKAKTLTHNLIRGKTLRRTLGIPNPIHFYRLARFVVENWNPLITAANKSTLSLTKPAESATGRLFTDPPISDKAIHRARTRAGCRYVVQADVARFYPTLYTHSVPWALHTKTAAKAHRGSGLGDTLDRIIRNGQDRQTNGIPIGPDTSLLVAEIVLGAVDEQFQRGHPANGFRYIDDYEVSCQTLREAEDVCNRLQEALSEYELALNPAKTRILELPLPLQEAPFSELRVLRLRAHISAQRTDLLRFFDRAFALAQQEPDMHILNFAVSRLNHSTVDQSNWPLLQDLMIQAAVIAPSCLRFVLDGIWRYREMGYPIDGARIAFGLNTVVCDRSPLGQVNEVAWALWGLLVLNESLSETSVAAAARLTDSVVALLLLHCREKALIPAATPLAAYLPFMKKQELSDRQWLLSYEANVKGWVPSTGGVVDHVSDDPCFGYLKRKGVSFYDATVLDTVTAPPSSFEEPSLLFPSGSARVSQAPSARETYE